MCPIYALSSTTKNLSTLSTCLKKYKLKRKTNGSHNIMMNFLFLNTHSKMLYKLYDKNENHYEVLITAARRSQYLEKKGCGVIRQ